MVQMRDKELQTVYGVSPNRKEMQRQADGQTTIPQAARTSTAESSK